MSAWLVSKRHIDCLTTAAIALGVTTKDEATEFGDMLWQENCRSLMARYGEKHIADGGDLPDPRSYNFEPYYTEDLYFVAMQIDCYDYQACEHVEYGESSARQSIDAMRGEIEKTLRLAMETIRLSESYDQAPWGCS